MKLDNSRWEYFAQYKETRWCCKIKNIEKSENIISFTVEGRGSSYRVFLIKFKETMWMDIPVMNISSELSSLDDIFWNSDKIGELLNSIIDGITIAKGIEYAYKIADGF